MTAAAAAVVDGLGWAWKSEETIQYPRYEVGNYSRSAMAIGNGNSVGFGGESALWQASVLYVLSIKTDFR